MNATTRRKTRRPMGDMTGREALTLSAYARTVELFRALDPEMPMQTVAVLMYVMQHPGCGVGDVADDMGMALSSASRNLAKLANVKPRRGVGRFGLIEMLEHPDERRRKFIRLSPLGERFLADVAKEFH